MQPVLQTASTQIDENVGFRYRTVYVFNENSVLHYHDYYEIFLTLENNVKHYINGSKEILPRGTLVFIRKSDAHIYEYSTSKKASFVNLAFTEEILNELFQFLTEGYPSKELLSLPHPPSILLQESDILWMLKQMEELNSTPATDIPQLKYRSRLLLFKIFTRYFSRIGRIEQSNNNVPSWLYELNLKMQKLEHFSQGPEHMVEMSGKCRAYLGRILKQYYGKTIPDYINDLRLNYWANSLINSDAPILDICYECGFENVSWAYTLFKEKYKMSPLKYRKTSQ